MRLTQYINRMEYHKTINLLDNETIYQSSSFRTKYWVEINDQIQLTYKLKSSLCDYSVAYIPLKGTIIVVGKGANVAAIAPYRNSREVIFKNCVPFTDCISETNNAQVDNAKDLDIVMS